MPVSALTLRLAKGSALTPGEMDGNLTKLRDFSNSLEQIVLTALDEDGNPNGDFIAILNAASYGDGTLSGGTYVVTLDPVPTAYAAGMKIWLRALTANTGGVDLNVNGLGAKNILKNVTEELTGGEIPLNGIVELIYDGTSFQLVTVYAGITASQLSEATRVGQHQYAAGTYSGGVYSVTLSPAPTAYAEGMVIRFKASNSNAGAATVNVNGLGAKTIVKGASTALSANDIVASQVVTAVYDGTNFQIVATRSAWDFIGTGAVPASGSATAIAHGLSQMPSDYRVVLLQNTAAAQQGFDQNDEMPIGAQRNDNNNHSAFSVAADVTNITLSRVDSGNITVVPKGGGAVAAITDANWLVKVYARL